MRSILRLGIAVLIVIAPASWLLWQWRYARNPVLEDLSFKSLDRELSGDYDPSFWVYALWVLGVFVVLTIAVRLVDTLLEKVIPNEPQR